jgi:hypothetical protein
MKQKLDEIRNLYGQLNPLRLEDRCYDDFRSIIEKILKLIKELHEEETDKSLKLNFLQLSSRLSRTLGREVTWIGSHQEKMRKMPTIKIRRKEYEKSIEDAISQVYADLVFAVKL